MEAQLLRLVVQRLFSALTDKLAGDIDYLARRMRGQSIFQIQLNTSRLQPGHNRSSFKIPSIRHCCFESKFMIKSPRFGRSNVRDAQELAKEFRNLFFGL